MYLLSLFFIVLQLINVNEAIECWTGSNDVRASNFPPQQVDCNADSVLDRVCQRIFSLGFHIADCALPDSCEGRKNNGLFDEVICCTENYCNAPDGSEGPIPPIPTPTPTPTPQPSTAIMVINHQIFALSFGLLLFLCL